MKSIALEAAQTHLESCADGPHCILRTAHAWARRIAREECRDEVHDLLVALHMNESRAHELEWSCEALSDVLVALLRRAPAGRARIAAAEMIGRGNLLFEDDDENALTVSVLPDPARSPETVEEGQPSALDGPGGRHHGLS